MSFDLLLGLMKPPFLERIPYQEGFLFTNPNSRLSLSSPTFSFKTGPYNSIGTLKLLNNFASWDPKKQYRDPKKANSIGTLKNSIGTLKLLTNPYLPLHFPYKKALATV